MSRIGNVTREGLRIENVIREGLAFYTKTEEVLKINFYIVEDIKKILSEFNSARL